MKPSPATFNFSLHDRVRGRVRGPKWFMGPVIHELSEHEDREDQHNNLDLDIELGGCRSDLPGAISNKESFAWTGTHLMARWKVCMSGPESRPVKLIFNGNLASRFVVSKWIVEPAIRIVAEEKGAAMVHAAALSDGDRAVLVAGPATAGKTTWVLNWLQAGHPYMSDDFTLLEHDKVMPYITPMRLGARNLTVNKVLSGMSNKDKIEIVIRTILRRTLLGYAKFYFKAPIKRAVPAITIGDPANLAGAIWLDKEDKTSSPEELAELMTGVDMDEIHGFGGDHLDSLTSTGFRADHRSKLAALLADKTCVCVNAHQLPPLEALSSVPKLLSWIQKTSL